MVLIVPRACDLIGKPGYIYDLLACAMDACRLLEGGAGFCLLCLSRCSHRTHAPSTTAPTFLAQAQGPRVKLHALQGARLHVHLHPPCTLHPTEEHRLHSTLLHSIAAPSPYTQGSSRELLNMLCAHSYLSILRALG